ncbi:MAG: ATP-binding protein, partial [Muribaculaceae bacterium]|nr:ATP-binding protein [Muribaculaceae bacterium]
CEIKFVTSEFEITKDYSQRLRNKIAAFKSATNTRKAIVPTMITTYGVKANMYSGIIQQQINLDTLFSF